VNSVRQERVKLRERKESLSFFRTSWFHEVKMSYDIYLGELDKESVFFKEWLSLESQRRASNCGQFMVGLLYEDDFSQINHSYIKRQLENKYQVEFIKLNEFSRFLSFHRFYEIWSLKGYKVYGLCLANEPESSLELDLPNYRPVRISP